MKAVTFYTGLLEAAGITVGENSELLIAQGGIEPTPITIGNKVLTLPTDANLRAGHEFWETHIAFHPISQSLVRKESSIFKKLRQILNVRIYTNVIRLMEVLGDVCNGQFDAADLTAEQLRFTADIAAIGTVTDKTIACLTRVLNVTTPEVKHRLVNIYIRKARSKKESYSRYADVSFPIFDTYEGSRPKLYDVPINSMGSYRAILAMFRFIFPESDEEQHYSRGSTDLTAPNLEALLLAFGGLAEQMNRSIHMFSNLIPEHEQLMIDLEWMEGLAELANFRMEIPAQPGNEGDPLDDHGSNMGLGDGSIVETPAESQQTLGTPMLKSIAPMSSGMKVPTVAAVAPVMPVATTVPVMPVTTTAPVMPVAKKAPTLGVPLTDTTGKAAPKSPFHQPAQTAQVAASASSSFAREAQNNLHNAQLQMQLEKERMQLQAAQMQNGMMPGMPAQMPGMVPGMMPNAMPQPAQQTYCQEYQTLTQALSTSNPMALQLINQNPSIAQILMTSPQACVAVMQNVGLLNNPAMLQQFAAPVNTTMQMPGAMQPSPEQIAAMTGLTPGRQKAQVQKQQQQLQQQQMLMQQQQQMMQRGMMPGMSPQMPGMVPGMMPGMTPQMPGMPVVNHAQGTSMGTMWK